MKRIIILAVALLLVLNLSSCNLIQSILTGSPVFKSDERIMKECADQLFSSLKEKDVKKLCGSFSAQVGGTGIFQEEAAGLINYIEGNVTSWIAVESPVVNSSSGEDGNTKEMWAGYDLITDEKHYCVYLYYVSVDNNGRNDEGLYSLWITEKNDDSEPHVSMKDMASIPGITIEYYEE